MYKSYKDPIYLLLFSYISAVDFRLDIPFIFEIVCVFKNVLNLVLHIKEIKDFTTFIQEIQIMNIKKSSHF